VSRFEAIGHFVYENGNRIGCIPDEAAVELARKLNAYQMRIERFKAENARLKAEVDRLAKCEGYHYTAVAVSMLKEQLQQKHIDYVESRKANEANVEMIKSLTAQVERLTKAGDLMCRMAGNNQVINRHWKTAKGVQS